MNKNNLPDNQSDLSTGGKIKVDAVLQDENMTQKIMGEFFGKERSVIAKDFNNFFSIGELDEERNVQKMHFGHSDKSIKFCNLDAIVPAINKHLANIYEKEDLRKELTISILETVQIKEELQVDSTV